VPTRAAASGAIFHCGTWRLRIERRRPADMIEPSEPAENNEHAEPTERIDSARRWTGRTCSCAGGCPALPEHRADVAFAALDPGRCRARDPRDGVDRPVRRSSPCESRTGRRRQGRRFARLRRGRARDHRARRRGSRRGRNRAGDHRPRGHRQDDGWRTGVERVCSQGWRVLVAEATGREVALSFAGLADLLATVDEVLLESPPPPQRGALSGSAPASRRRRPFGLQPTALPPGRLRPLRSAPSPSE